MRTVHMWLQYSECLIPSFHPQTISLCVSHSILPPAGSASDQGLLDKLRGNVKELEAEESSDGIRQHYKNTLAHVTHAMANDSTLYSDVEV